VSSTGPGAGGWLPYGHQHIDEGDVDAVVQALRSDWITQGPRIAEFERQLAERCGAAYAVAFASGTAALHAACAAAGIGTGDEAITTPLTFVATANAVVYCGGTPRLADIEAETLNLDVRTVEPLVTARTRAILPVDFAGQPADLDAVLAVARRHGLLVIEDAAHALGATSRGRPVGAVADMTVLSFHPVKHVTTGEGGMVVTQDAGLAERLRTVRHHGIVQPDPARPWLYEVATLGFNYRITDLQCALGSSQLRKLDGWLTRRRSLAARYRTALAAVPGVAVPSIRPDVEHAWHIFVVRLTEAAGATRDEVVARLRAAGIGATVHYPLVHLHPYYRKTFGYGEGLCPVAERIQPRLLTLPLFPAMSDGDVDRVVDALRRALGGG
jgi:perosamine synthetase